MTLWGNQFCLLHQCKNSHREEGSGAPLPDVAAESFGKVGRPEAWITSDCSFPKRCACLLNMSVASLSRGGQEHGQAENFPTQRLQQPFKRKTSLFHTVTSSKWVQQFYYYYYWAFIPPHPTSRFWVGNNKSHTIYIKQNRIIES